MTAKATMINSSIEQLRKIADELESSSGIGLSAVKKLHEAANELVALANSLVRCERVDFADVWPKKLCKKDAERYRLPLYLGVTTEGKKHIVDLARMPHLLVGGNDARGKSNLIHSIVCGLTQLLSPEQVRFVIFDTTCSDFVSYMRLPHLAHPIITEELTYSSMLDSLIVEMERRLKLFGRARCRNIDYEELYEMALEIIRTTKRASIPHFQIQMGIGYNHASRLMDLLEERGVVGERKDGLQREIKIDLENDDEMD